MTVAVGQGILAALWNALEARFVLSHVEWTATSASVATNTLASIGTLTYDSSPSNVSTTALATISTNTLTIVADGIYDLAFSGSLPVAPTGATMLQVGDGTNNFKVTHPIVGTTWGGSVASGWRWPAGTVITFQFLHNSAASRVLTSRLSLTKVGVYA